MGTQLILKESCSQLEATGEILKEENRELKEACSNYIYSDAFRTFKVETNDRHAQLG